MRRRKSSWRQRKLDYAAAMEGALNLEQELTAKRSELNNPTTDTDAALLVGLLREFEGRTLEAQAGAMKKKVDMVEREQEVIDLRLELFALQKKLAVGK